MGPPFHVDRLAILRLTWRLLFVYYNLLFIDGYIRRFLQLSILAYKYQNAYSRWKKNKLFV